MDEDNKGNWSSVVPIIILVVLYCLYVLSMTVG